MALSLLVTMVGFAPSPLSSTYRPSMMHPPVKMIVDPSLIDAGLFDPGLFAESSRGAVDFGTFGRAGMFGLMVYGILSVADSPSKKLAKLRAEQRMQPDVAAQQFGYLNADLSVPLPPLKELSDSCHRIGAKEGSTFYLCGQPSQQFSCALSESFSEYYGESVYVCRQG